ncbi:UV DNA damage repair endonuclease UvsE [Anoxybacillus sp. D401a]|uniref:UV DNA damage repair endonuclease UvsE n=1 Tax=Anoxybacillus sp. D401a TaxID=575112 RepID=UPI003D34D912
MTVIRLGYVAMSRHLKNCSPSQTMTVAQFLKIKDREAAIRKLERIAQSNIQHCLRLLKHNIAHDIRFFRLSSKLIPLANHQELSDWDYMKSIESDLEEMASFLSHHPMRIDFHPDHFVLLNSTDPHIFRTSIATLRMHERLLKGMKIDPLHRCVLHVGGGYDDKELALEQFVHNWGSVPYSLQRMIMLENDDMTFTLRDTLYLCEKLGIPLVFDLHHHDANHDQDWRVEWDRVTASWTHSPLPLKMHMSSPRSEKQFRAHHDFVSAEQFMNFLHEVKGTVSHIDCMLEAKQKDEALFRLVSELKKYDEIEWIDGASFYVR